MNRYHWHDNPTPDTDDGMDAGWLLFWSAVGLTVWTVAIWCLLLALRGIL